jgi:hypothetical protein
MERVLNILNDCEGDERKTVDDGQLLTTDGAPTYTSGPARKVIYRKAGSGESSFRWLTSLPGKHLLRHS